MSQDNPVDLNLIEESSNSPEVTVAILAESGKVTLLQVKILLLKNIVTKFIPVKQYCVKFYNLLDEAPESFTNLLPFSHHIVLVAPNKQSESRLSLKKLQAVAQLAKAGCREICDVMDKALRKNVKDLFGKMEA